MPPMYTDTGKGDVYHAVKVAELKAAILELRDDDLLVPNEVRNLAIIRDGDFVGWIDFGQGAAVEYAKEDS